MATPAANTTLVSLAAELGLTPVDLTKWSYKAQLTSAYSNFTITKRSGGIREISAPSGGLRNLQRRLLLILSEWYRPRACVHGFTKSCSIVSNASEHTRRSVVLNVDLADFFPSINFGRIRGMLMAKPFLLECDVATVITRLTCQQNGLPQGAPTSPILANMICMKLDGELLRLAQGLKCRYTRYADDLTFSTNMKSLPSELAVSPSAPHGTHAIPGPTLAAIVESNGFKINEKKVRVYHRSNAQRVTGLTVNRHPNVHRTYVRQLRAMIHAWETFGLDAAEAEYRLKYIRPNRAPFRKPPSFARVVHGKLMFLGMVRGFSDSLYLTYARKCRLLSPVMFSSVLDREETLFRNIWVLECEETSSQGTAFFLSDFGMVTCAHVLGSSTVAFHPSAPGNRFPVHIVCRDDHLDLAVLRIGLRMKHPLPLGQPDKLRSHSRILLAGYPSFGFSDGLYRAWGTVTAERTRHAVKYFVPSIPIADGNSGGPVIDEHYKVVGVAARGVKNLADSTGTAHDAYGVISIEHLKTLTRSAGVQTQ